MCLSKQKTAYSERISDGSSDVWSSDLLAGSEQQHVALARAVAPRPALLLADEPTGNLDGTTGHTIIDLMFGEAARLKSTLILITHDEALAALRSDERRVGTACVSPGRSRWSQYHYNKNTSAYINLSTIAYRLMTS